MRKSIVIFLTVILFAAHLFILSGCNNSNNGNEEKRDKVKQELDYLDIKLIEIANNLNNLSLGSYTITSEEISMSTDTSGKSKGASESQQSSSTQEGTDEKENKSNSQSSMQENSGSSNITVTQMDKNTTLDTDENDIEWKEIKSQIEIINEAWGTIILDLTSINVNNDDILNFSEVLNNTILRIKDENKKDTLTNISKLYSYIPKFERSANLENSIQNIKQVKSNLIDSYALIENDDWTGIDKNMRDAEETFKNIMNDMNYIKDKEYKVNNTYVLMKELQNSTKYKDKKIFYIKYKNLMESINSL